MAIPTTPLIISKYDVDNLTLAENRTLFGGTYTIDDFYQFLIDYTDHDKSWTVEEIGKIKRTELTDVRRQLFEALVNLKESEAQPAGAPPLAEAAT